MYISCIVNFIIIIIIVIIVIIIMILFRERDSELDQIINCTHMYFIKFANG